MKRQQPSRIGRQQFYIKGQQSLATRAQRSQDLRFPMMLRSHCPKPSWSLLAKRARCWIEKATIMHRKATILYRKATILATYGRARESFGCRLRVKAMHPGHGNDGGSAPATNQLPPFHELLTTYYRARESFGCRLRVMAMHPGHGNDVGTPPITNQPPPSTNTSQPGSTLKQESFDHPMMPELMPIGHHSP